MDWLQIVQAVIGFALFFASGWFLSRAFFKRREADAAERIALGLALALTAPALVLVFLNLVLRIPFNVFSVYATLLVLIAASIYWTKTK